MARRLRVDIQSWPIRGEFRIARGAKTEAQVIVAQITENGATGYGECVPYPRYGETVERVAAEIQSLCAEIENGLTREALQQRMRAGAARNALDCALIDLEAKQSGRPVFELLNLSAPRPVQTAFTLSLHSPEAMGATAAEAAARGYGLLKLKIAGGDDLARVEAVRRNAPAARLIVDANEGWSRDELVVLSPALARLGVALIEQPLKAEEDEVLAGFESPVPLCADESCHTRADLPPIVGRYSHINIKLDKAGGLTEALALAREATALGLHLMVGCMVSTSLSMAPASLLAGMAEFVDLDGPLLLARDRIPAIRYEADRLYPADPQLWG
jgi:L-alanine-DL-glutamate epimerase-like enolase superfamily enzyme